MRELTLSHLRDFFTALGAHCTQLRQQQIDREKLYDAMVLMIQQGKCYDLSAAYDIRQRFEEVMRF